MVQAIEFNEAIELNEAIEQCVEPRPNPTQFRQFRTAWSVAWRIAAIPLVVFLVGLTILGLIEHDSASAVKSKADREYRVRIDQPRHSSMTP